MAAITVTHPIFGTYQVHSAAALAVARKNGATPVVEKRTDDTVNGIKRWVGDDKDRATEALATEKAADKPRVSLIAHLETIVGDADTED